jgi:hypothetical protein
MELLIHILNLIKKLIIAIVNGVCGRFSFAANVLRLGVCYFALQTFKALDKINRQNNSTKPLLVAGAV